MVRKTVSKRAKQKNNGSEIRKVKKNSILPIFIISLILFVLQALFSFNVFGSEHNTVLGNIFLTSASFLAFIASVILYFKIPRESFVERKSYFFMMIGILLFFFGDLIWLVNEVYLNNLVPIGGIPDFAWNLAYICLIIAVSFIISTRDKSTKFIFYILLALVALAGIFLVYQDMSEDLALGTFTFAHALQDTYILYDFVLILMLLCLVYPLLISKSPELIFFVVLVFGVVTRLVYDKIFVNMSEKGTYYTGHPIDLLYVCFYLLFILSAFFKYKLLSLKSN